LACRLGRVPADDANFEPNCSSAVNCAWLQNLTEYDCREVRAIGGAQAIEVSTPFVMTGGAPIALYLVDQGAHVLFSDNADTLASLCAVGIDPFRSLAKLRRRVQRYGLTLTPEGAFEVLAKREAAPMAFARAVSALLLVADWGADVMQAKRPTFDLAQEALPYIVARDNNAVLERNRAIIGASNATHVFDIRHGLDLIDVIPPKPQATGAEMRKVGDVQNGPHAGGMRPLIIVDDRQDPIRALQEIAILASITRVMSFNDLTAARH